MRITFSCDEREARDLRDLAAASGEPVSKLVRLGLQSVFGIGLTSRDEEDGA